MNKEKRSLLKNSGVQSFIASIICILLGLLLGYIVLLFINPAGAGEAITALIKNFLISQYTDSTEVFRKHARQNGTAYYVLAFHTVCI